MLRRGLFLVCLCSSMAAGQIATTTPEAVLLTTTATNETASNDKLNTNEDGIEIGEETPLETASKNESAEAVPLASEDLADLQKPSQAGSAAHQAKSTNASTAVPVQTGPLIDLLGPKLMSLEMIGENRAQLKTHLTSDALRKKKVIGLYFSADWYVHFFYPLDFVDCVFTLISRFQIRPTTFRHPRTSHDERCGPCRKFTPELVQFYRKINSRRGKKDQFEIVWVSRCRDVNSFGQYFTHMGGWYALPPEEAMGKRGQILSDKYRVRSIPTLVLLDDLGNVITTDARNKIPTDKAGIGFPWRNPVATLYMTLVPRSIRLLVKAQVVAVKENLLQSIGQILQPKRKQRA